MVRITLSIPNIYQHIMDDLIGNIESKRGRITNIEIDYLLPHGLKLLRFIKDRATDGVTQIIESVTFDERRFGHDV